MSTPRRKRHAVVQGTTPGKPKEKFPHHSVVKKTLFTPEVGLLYQSQRVLFLQLYNGSYCSISLQHKKAQLFYNSICDLAAVFLLTIV